MKDFEVRLFKELQELDFKMDGLNKFLHGEDLKSIDGVVVLMLQAQYHAMASYRECLRGRMEYIGLFKKGN